MKLHTKYILSISKPKITPFAITENTLNIYILSCLLYMALSVILALQYELHLSLYVG